MAKDLQAAGYDVHLLSGDMMMKKIICSIYLGPGFRSISIKVHRIS